MKPTAKVGLFLGAEKKRKYFFWYLKFLDPPGGRYTKVIHILTPLSKGNSMVPLSAL